MALPETTKEQVLEAIGRFDRELRSRAEWAGWEGNGNFEYALEHAGSLYPPKEIISLATGMDKSSFSGGEQSNGYLRKLGFVIRPLRADESNGALTGLSEALVGILKEYGAARDGGAMSKQHPVADRFRVAVESLRESLPVKSRPNIKVVHSTGKGNWAAVPWISLLDVRETDTTQRGRYVVFLFREDCTGVYLTLNQGVTEPISELGRPAGRLRLRERAAEMRRALPDLTEKGFFLNDEIRLKPDGLGADYEASTIAHKFYPANAIPPDRDLQVDLEAILGAYDRVLNISTPAVTKARAWIFQSNPDIFDVVAAARGLRELTWLVRRHAADIHVGDSVYLWESGPSAGIVATAEVIAKVVNREEDPASAPFMRKAETLTGPQPRALLRITRVLDETLSKTRLVEDPTFADLSFLKAPMGTNFAITEAHRKAIDAMLDATSARSLGPEELCSSFSLALRASGLSFGVQHGGIVRSFFCSVLAKPFVILTGLSGSGKTQLALKLGEWLGERRYRVVPVRPDWTGPESLLGYEDALLPVDHGRRAWHVPDALELMLRAAQDPQRPYLLVLDEMNLAHVERYFADVLSGVESREAVLPNLQQEADGYWRVPHAQSAIRTMPRNLIIVGTVNVDETTYMFSPKVLDRANTIEFRVPTDALPIEPEAVARPGRCSPANNNELSSLLRIAIDDTWHVMNATASLATFASTVRQIHEGLALHSYEFGHRTYYESLRLAALIMSGGEDGVEQAVDIFLLQKILPRLHGARRTLEPVLRSLGAFAFESRPMTSSAGDFDVLGVPANKVPAMPRTFAKVSRMMKALHANQFASF